MLFAGCALQAGNVLAGEEVGEAGVVAVFVTGPFFHGCDKGGRAFALGFFFEGELPERSAVPVGVEVFVQDIDEEFEEFFGVLLSVAGPFFVETCAEFLMKVSKHSKWKTTSLNDIL